MRLNCHILIDINETLIQEISSSVIFYLFEALAYYDKFMPHFINFIFLHVPEHFLPAFPYLDNYLHLMGTYLA